MIEGAVASYETAAVFVEGLLLPYGVYGLFVLSFFNSSVSPVPTEVLLVPLVLLQPEDALLYGTVATGASVLGAWFAYYLGAYGRFVTVLVNDKHLALAQGILQEHGVVIVGVSGISPLPFKLFCIASGVFRLDLPRVLGVSLAFRGLRFYGISLLLAVYGGAMLTFVEEHLWLATTAIAAMVVAAYLAYRRVMSIEVR